MLGWLKPSRPEIDGLTGLESNPLNLSDPSSPVLHVSDQAFFVDSDPGHSFQAIREQIFGSSKPLMNGFAQQADSMTSLPGLAEPEALPVYTSLAENFAVFDKWFASVPGSTQPNRFYVHSATSHGATSEKTSSTASLRKPSSNQLPKTPSRFQYITKTSRLPCSSRGEFPQLLLEIEATREAREGAELRKEMPANDDHPSHDVARGQRLVKEVYETAVERDRVDHHV